MKKKKKDKYSKILLIAQYIEKGRLSQKMIAETVHVSKNLVSTVSNVMRDKAWTAEDVSVLSEEEIEQVFKRSDAPTQTSKKESVYAEPDYDFYCTEFLKRGVTRALLHEEYVESCYRAGLIPLQLTQFKVHLNEHLRKKPFSEIINHQPGAETEVDWTGDKAYWTDPDTGEICSAWLFVGVLPFSGLGYAEVFPDMKLPNWIAAHVHMFEYFGGTTHTLICDNLKTGVIKHPVNGDVILQKDYEAFANYYGMAIVPARVRTPTDKPSAENLVGKLETHILARLRNIQCFSIEEYNIAVRKALDRFNEKPFQKKEGNRRSVFEDYERTEMIPLPATQYEYFQKKNAKVQSNCCISHGKNYYSVPYKYIGETVTLRVYNDRLDVYAGYEKLCTHKLIHGKIGMYSIDNSHLPPYSANYGDWNSSRFKNWARNIGPYTYEVIDRLFSTGVSEQRYYNTARSILKLADQYPRARVEQACQLALKQFKRPVYRNIKAILYNGQDYTTIPYEYNEDIDQKPKEEKSYVRGAEYYAEKKD